MNLISYFTKCSLDFLGKKYLSKDNPRISLVFQASFGKGVFKCIAISKYLISHKEVGASA